MLKFLILMLPISLLMACSEQNDNGPDDGPPPSRPSWELIWSDEFDGSALDLDKWEYQIGDGRSEGIAGWGNQELQYYKEENVTVENGNLVITSISENVMIDPTQPPDNQFGYQASYEYSSGRIRTQGKFDFTYGRVEARIKMPITKGIWNAFWLLGSDPSPYGVWPARGEIDIIEAYFRGDMAGESYASAAAHWGASGVSGLDCAEGVSVCRSKRFNDFDIRGEEGSVDHYDGFHVYAVEWDAEQIRWYVDGINYFTLRSDNYWNYFQDPVNGFQAGGENAPFDQNFHIILNAAVGGTLPTDVAGEPPDGSVMMNDQMLVDYVRVYQCSDSDRGGANCRNNFDPDGQNFVKEFLSFEFPEDDRFSLLLDLYLDGPNLERIPIDREIELVAVNGAVMTEVTENGNTYIDINAPNFSDPLNLPGVRILDSDDDNFIIGGFGTGPFSGAGDIKFDLYVDSDSANPQEDILISVVDDDGSQRFYVLDLGQYTPDMWHRVTIPFIDILNGAALGGSLDIGAIKEFIRFDIYNVHIRLDNIQFACGAGPCGIVDEVPVYTNGVDPVWDRGIVGDDTDQRFLFNNANYSDGTQYHVRWEEIDTGLPGFDTVVQTSFGNSGTVGAVNFVGSTNPVPSIGALTSGELRFDIRVIENPNDVILLFKVDALDENLQGTSTGEQPLGVLPVVGPNGNWTRFVCPIQTLVEQGLNTSQITAPFVLVPGNRGAGQGLVVQWDNVIFDPISSGDVTPLQLPLVFDDLPGFCLPIQPFAGGVFNRAENPAPDSLNNNAEVLRIRKFDPGSGETFGGVSFNLTTDIEFGPANSNVGKQFRIKTWSPRVGLPVTFKLELLSPPGAGIARVFETTVANQWEEFVIDFSGEAEESYPKLVIIPDNGVLGDGSDDFTIYVDQIMQEDAGSTPADLTAVYDFDQPNTTYPLTDFDNAQSSVTSGPVGDLGNRGNVGTVTLPNFASASAGTVMGGAQGFAVPIPLSLSRNQISVRVWTPNANTDVLLKIEDAVDGFQADEDTQTTSAGGQWETLTFDFSDADVNQSFEKLIIIFDPGQSRNGETYYWDDVTLLP